MTQVHLPRNEAVTEVAPAKKFTVFANVWFIFFKAMNERIAAVDTLTTRVDAAAAVAPVASPDAGAAPVGYTQAHSQALATELAEVKAQLNAVIAALNT